MKVLLRPLAPCSRREPTRIAQDRGPRHARFSRAGVAGWSEAQPWECFRGGQPPYATPPKGHSRMRFAVPPTCRQAMACPNSCVSTIKNSARYSKTFQTIEEYRPCRFSISMMATRNQVQCRNKSTPARRKRWIEPRCRLGMCVAYSVRIAPCGQPEAGACFKKPARRGKYQRTTGSLALEPIQIRSRAEANGGILVRSRKTKRKFRSISALTNLLSKSRSVRF
jgi:hypothetical protein